MVLTKKEIIDRINISARHTYKFIDPVDTDNIKVKLAIFVPL